MQVKLILTKKKNNYLERNMKYLLKNFMNRKNKAKIIKKKTYFLIN